MAKYISQRAIQRQKKRLKKKVIFFFVLLGLLLFSSSWLSKLEKFNIRNINIEGNSIIKDEEILKIINKNISGKYLRLFSKSQFLIYPKSKIETEIVDSFAQIKELKIGFGDFHSIVVDVVERKPYAIWCDDIADERCYFMDKTAYIYDRAPNFFNGIYFKYFGGLEGVSTSTPTTQILKRIYLEQEKLGQFGKVNLFIRFLKDININSYKLVVKENNDYELFFNGESKLIFDGNQDLDEIFENLQATLVEFGDLEDKEFEYIDLRFDRKILYKFR